MAENSKSSTSTSTSTKRGQPGVGRKRKSSLQGGHDRLDEPHAALEPTTSSLTTNTREEERNDLKEAVPRSYPIYKKYKASNSLFSGTTLGELYVNIPQQRLEPTTARHSLSRKAKSKTPLLSPPLSTIQRLASNCVADAASHALCPTGFSKIPPTSPSETATHSTRILRSMTKARQTRTSWGKDPHDKHVAIARECLHGSAMNIEQMHSDGPPPTQDTPKTSSNKRDEENDTHTDGESEYDFVEHPFPEDRNRYRQRPAEILNSNNSLRTPLVLICFDTGSQSNFISSTVVKNFKLKERPLRPNDVVTYCGLTGECRPLIYITLKLRFPPNHEFKESFRVVDNNNFELILGSSSINERGIELQENNSQRAWPAFKKKPTEEQIAIQKAMKEIDRKNATALKQNKNSKPSDSLSNTNTQETSTSSHKSWSSSQYAKG